MWWSVCAFAFASVSQSVCLSAQQSIRTFRLHATLLQRRYPAIATANANNGGWDKAGSLVAVCQCNSDPLQGRAAAARHRASSTNGRHWRRRRHLSVSNGSHNNDSSNRRWCIARTSAQATATATLVGWCRCWWWLRSCLRSTVYWKKRHRFHCCCCYCHSVVTPLLLSEVSAERQRFPAALSPDDQPAASKWQSALPSLLRFGFTAFLAFFDGALLATDWLAHSERSFIRPLDSGAPSWYAAARKRKRLWRWQRSRQRRQQATSVLIVEAAAA